MAGSFLTAKYEADSGEIHPIRVQPETIFATNAQPAGAVTNAQTVRVSGSKRAYGIKARSLTLYRIVGATDDYSGARVYARIPIMTATALDAFTKGATLAYQGVDWVVGDTSAETSI